METGDAVSPVGTDGGVVSLDTTLKAAACMIQPALDVAVALKDPEAVRIFSSPRLLLYVDLAVNPEPLVQAESETQNPKSRSPATVTAIGPLETLEDEPLACALPSSGESLLMPLYSKI